MKRPGAVAVSPDGRWIVAALAEPAYDEERKRSDLWIVPSDCSAAPRRLTTGKGSEGSRAFRPDGRSILFVGLAYRDAGGAVARRREPGP